MCYAETPPPPPVFPCPEGEVRNPTTKLCECPPGQVRNPTTKLCECPPGYEWDAVRKECVLPDYTKKITITSPIQFGGLLKGDINAKYKTQRVQKMGTYGPLTDPRKKQPIMEDKEVLDESGKKIVVYKWDNFAPFILSDISTAIDGSIKSMVFMIKKTNPIFFGEYRDHLGKMFVDNAPREDENNYIYTLKKGQNTIAAQANTWDITPIKVNVVPCPKLLAEAAVLAKIPSREGFETNDPLIMIEFNFSESENVRDEKGKPKILVAPPLIIAAKSITKYINHEGKEIQIPSGTSPTKIANYVRAALLPGAVTPPSTPRSGGAIQHIDDSLDEIPYLMALQKLWEKKQAHYKEIEPEYQKMLPEPDEAPIHKFKEPFHHYMDHFADQEALEEARETIGLMRPEEAEDLFVNDNSRVNSLYEKALPEINRDWVPIFIRADILRMLMKKH